MNAAQRRSLARSEEPLDYNPTRAAAKYNAQPLSMVVRVLQIGSSLGGFIIDVIIDNQRGLFESNAKVRGVAFGLLTYGLRAVLGQCVLGVRRLPQGLHVALMSATLQ
jgi:hypothetical protein